MDVPDTGHAIEGEVFQVDDSTLAGLDILEGVASGKYYRDSIEVHVRTTCSAEALRLTCACYFFRARSELMSQERISHYSAEHHALYSPVGVDERIVALCGGETPTPKEALEHEAQGRAGLQTGKAVPMLTHSLRLLPGEDLLEALQRFATEHQILAAVILTCVGSTARTTLRPAGVPEGRVFDGKFEIVSLTGTIAADDRGHHLHMSISDPECNVFGGHVLKGCIVRTTAEITLGLLQGVAFSRPLDNRTGYDELSISMLPRPGP